MKKLARWGLAAFVGLFLCLCLLPSAGMLAAPAEEAVGNEHLTAMPALQNADGSWNKSYFSELSSWLSDHIAFRHELITLHARLCGALFGTLPSEDVVLGADGWLYYADTLPDYQGAGLMTERECWAAARVLALMQEYCQERGAQFLFTVAPNKNSLYPEAMPARYQRSGAAGNAQRIAGRLEEMGVPYLDLFALLGGQEQTLYFRTDSHWNTLGAALAGDAISSALGKPEDPFWGQPYQTAPTHKGDLYEMVYPAGDLLEDDAVFDRAFRFTYPNGLRSAEDITIRTQNEGETGSLLMFRDSFGNALYPFLAERYGAACFSRAMPYNLTYLEREQAGTLVVEIVERNLRWLVQRPAVMPAPQREDARLAGRWRGRGRRRRPQQRTGGVCGGQRRHPVPGDGCGFPHLPAGRRPGLRGLAGRGGGVPLHRLPARRGGRPAAGTGGVLPGRVAVLHGRAGSGGINVASQGPSGPC